MPDVDYILRIILKAKDEMALVLSKARTQLRGFTTDANNMDKAVGKLNKSMEKFDGHMGNVAKKLEAWRAVLRDAGDDSNSLTKSVDNFGKATEKTVNQTKKAVEATTAYKAKIDELGKAFIKLNDDYGKGHVSRENYIKDLQRIGGEYDSLSKKSKVTTELARALRKGGDEAKRQAQILIDADKEIVAVQKEKEAAIKKAAEASQKAADAAKKANDAARAAIPTQKELQRQARGYRDEIRKVSKEQDAGNLSTRVATSELNRLGKALELLTLKMTDASRRRTPASLWADEAESAVERMKGINDRSVADAKERVAEERSLLADITKAVENHTALRRDIERGADADAKGRSEAATRRAKESTDAIVNELLRRQAEQERIVKESEARVESARLANVKLRNAAIAREIEQQITAEIAENKAKHKQLGEELKANYDKEVAEARAHHKQLGEELLAKYNADVAEARRTHKQIGEDLKANYDKQVAEARAHHKQLGEELKARYDADVALTNKHHKQIGEELLANYNAEVAYDKKRQGVLDRRAAQEKERNRLARESARIDRGEASPAEIKQTISDYNALSRGYSRSSFRVREYANEVERLRLVHRKLTTDTDKSTSAFARFREGLKGGESNVAGFDNELRGMGLLLTVASAQQLISAVTALGGELVSLAGSAAMAGGALGGILAAGAAQALPVIGLLAGAFQRVSSVMDVIQQSQLLDKAQFADAAKSQDKAIDQANTLANAHDAVADANDRLAESRDNLTKAQKEGTEQLEDLITAEKNAALAAKGAALDVKSAQEALAQAIRSGADQLEIDQKRQALAEARNSQGGARTTLRRATRDRVAAGGNVNNLEPVKAAAKQVEDAEKAVTKANRGLDQAEDKTNRIAASTMTAAANLDFLLSQLSPSERKLYEAATKLYESYKRIFQGEGTDGSGIYGVIIDAFTRAVEQVEKIMEMPKVIAAITKLAGVIGDNIDKVVGAVADPSVLNQLIGLIDAASENLGPVVDIVIKLGKAFLNIAETANPAFQKLLEYIGPIIDKFLAMTADKDKMEEFFLTGEQHLESWLDLVLAVIRLFAILFGASMDDGKKSIDDLTEKINGYSDSLEKNIGKVKKFFGDARESAYKLGGVVENLAKTLFATFDAERVENFTKVLNSVVIPAIATLLDVTGQVVDAIAQLADMPVVREVAKWLLVFALFSKISFGIVGIFDKLAGAFERVGKVAKFLKLDALVKWFGQLAKALPLVSTAIEAISGIALGPVAAIAAVVAAVVLLLWYFDKLDGIWNAIKETAQRFMDVVTPAFKDLQKTLGDAGIKIDDFGVVLDALKFVGQQLADFFSKYLIESIKGLGKVIGGVVSAIIYTLSAFIKMWKGIFDVIIGIATLDGDQIKKGLDEIFDGFISFGHAIVDGLGEVLGGLIQVFLAPFKGAWAAVKDFFKIASPSKLAMELGEAIIDGIVAGFKAASKAVAGLARWVWNKIEQGWHALGNAVDRAAGWLWDKLADAIRMEIRGATRIANWIWDKIKDGWYALGSSIRKLVSWVWEKFTGFLRTEIRGFKNIGTWIYDMLSDSIHNIGSKLESLGGRIINAIVKGIKAAPKAIGDAIDWLLDKVPGGGAIKKGLEVIGKAERALFAEGGPVPGQGSGDTVPAMLTPGEHVLTKGEVASAGGHAVIFALRRLLGGGMQGGPFKFALGGAAYDARTGTYHGGATAAAAGYDPLTSIDYEAAAKRAQEARKKEAEERKRDLSTQREDYKRSGDERAQANRVMWNDILTTTRRFANDTETQIREMRVNSTRTFARLSRDILSSWASTWNSLMNVTYEGLTYIGHETNKALTALGEKHIDFNLAAPKKSSGNEGGATTSTDHAPGGTFAAGGVVGNMGERGRDVIPAFVGRGEAILNHAHQAYVAPAVQAFYGHPWAETFNRVRGYHTGGYGQTGFAGGKAPEFGPIPGMPGEEANTRIIPLLTRLIKRYHAVVTDAYDRDHSAGHKSPGHNVTGTAVDMIPGPGGNWDMIEAMGKWAVGQGMVVGYGAGVPGSQPWPNHGRNLHIHIEMGNGSGASVAGQVLAETVAKIGRPLVKGGGKLATLAQASIDHVRKAANAKLSETFAATSGGASDFDVGSGESAKKVFDFFVARGLSAAQSAGITGTFQKESNFSTTVPNATGSGAYGLAQWLGSRLEVLKRKANWQSLQTQLNYVWEELMGPEHGALTSLRQATTPSQAAQIFDSQYERSDRILNAAGYAEAWFKKFAKGMAVGGIVDGPDGAPTPILAHAGEWVLNKGQQLRAAMLSGLSVAGLRSMLGFHGSDSGAAGGTEVGRLTRKVGRGALEAGDLLEGVPEALDEVREVMRAIKKLGPKFTNIADLVDLATKDGGLLDNLRTSIERKFSQAALTLRGSRLQVRAGRVVGRIGNDISDAKADLSARQGERQDLTDERRQIRGELDEVAIRVGKTKNKKQKDALIARQVSLQKRLDEANERVIQNEEDIYAAQTTLAKAEEDAAEARKKAMQDMVDAVKDKYTKLGNAADRAKRVATVLGVGMEAINNTIQANMKNNLDDLQGALAKAEQGGQTEIADGLREDIAELQTSIQEFAQQRIQDTIDAVNKTASRRMSRLDLFGRMASAIGVVSDQTGVNVGGEVLSRAGVFGQRTAALTQQRTGLQGALRQAETGGNMQLVQDLTDQLAELDVSIAENTRAQFDAKVQQVTSTHDYSQSMIDLQLQLNDLTNATDEASRIAQQRILLGQKDTDLLAKKTELDALLLETQVGTQQYQDLQKAILENKIALGQNTKALGELTGQGSAPVTFTSTAWQWFRRAQNNGLGDLMPQYTPPGGASFTSDFPGGGPASSNSVRSATYTTNIEVNEVGQPIDTTNLASTIVFAQSTAPAP